MSNMSYCRFRNTLIDLRDCADTLEDINGEGDHNLSTEERRAALALLEICSLIAAEAEVLENILRQKGGSD